MVFKLMRNAILSNTIPMVIVWLFAQKLKGNFNLYYVWVVTIAGTMVYGYMTYKDEFYTRHRDFFFSYKRGLLWTIPVYLGVLSLSFFDKAHPFNPAASFLVIALSIWIHDLIGTLAPNFIQIAQSPTYLKYHHKYQKQNKEKKQ